MTYTFSILHISDLHERGPREKERYRRQRVLGDAWRQNLDELCREDRIDLVCFTGDLADWGQAAEYERISPFLDKLLAYLSLQRSRLFIVPGNHDIDRSVAKGEWEQLRASLPGADPSGLSISRWLENGKTPFGFKDTWRDAVLSRQANYRTWLKQFGLSAQVPGESGRLIGYRAPLQLPGMPFELHIIGLDSAWLSGDHADAGKLRLTDGQVQTLCTDPEEGKPWGGFRLALVHHPLTDLVDGGQCRRLLAQSVDLLLRGHLHDTEVDLWADPDRSLRAIAAGCLYEGDSADRFPNSCILIRVTCDDTGRPLRYGLRFRSFSPRGGFWHNDSSLYRGAQYGGLVIEPVATKGVSHENDSARPPEEPVIRSGAASPPGPQSPSAVPAILVGGACAVALPDALTAQQPANAKPAPMGGAVIAHPLPADTQIDDYRIVRLLGQGGMGAVYEAIKVSIGRRVALKFLLADVARHPDAIRRFVNEARSSSRIEHPAIIEIFEAANAPDGTPYLVMEFVRGETLAARLRRVVADNGRLPLTQGLQVAWQIAAALAATHGQGIVHRDLKPDNIMLVPDVAVAGKERVKLLDFGIAKLAQEVTAEQPVTKQNQLLGTPMYMSPEQCRSAAGVDAKSDVYALGVVLYEILAGRPPFQAEQVVQFLAQHLFEAPPQMSVAVPRLPGGLAELVHAMLAKDKDARPTMREVADDLEGYLSSATQGSHESTLSKLKRLLGLGGVVILLMGGSVASARATLRMTESVPLTVQAPRNAATDVITPSFLSLSPLASSPASSSGPLDPYLFLFDTVRKKSSV